MITLHPSALGKTKWWEYFIRFAFGGAVTVATGMIARRYGPSVGGLFLAFPAILPASLTLLQQHDGRPHVAQAAAGARLGAVGLVAFAAVAALLSSGGNAWATLVSASAVWCAASFLLWYCAYGR